MKTSFQVVALFLLGGIFLCLLALVWELRPRQTDSTATRPATLSSRRTAPSPLASRNLPHTSTTKVSATSQPELASAAFESALTLGELPGETHRLAESVTIVGTHRAESVNAAFPTEAKSPSGLIVGRIILEGVPPPEIPISMDATCGKLHSEPITTRHFVVDEEGGLADVVIYLTGPAIGSYSTPAEIQELHNKRCFFEPYVFGIQAGQVLRVVNDDLLLHNVHATPRDNPEFNVGLPVRDQHVDRVLYNPEFFVRFKCDVHPWMFAYANVFDHPYYTVSKSDGTYQIQGPVAPGGYTLVAEHRKAGRQEKDIRLLEGEELRADFRFQAPRFATR